MSIRNEHGRLLGALLASCMLMQAALPQNAAAFALLEDRRTDGAVQSLLWSNQFLRRDADGNLVRDAQNRFILDLGVAGVNLNNADQASLGFAVGTWQALAPPQQPNGQPGPNIEAMQAGDNAKVIRGQRFDLESILLHELGHAIGLDHPNLADRTPNAGNNRRFAASLQGQEPTDPVPVYHLNAGNDGKPGTNDDVRNGDRSLNFVAGTNNPFVPSNGPFLLDGPFNAPRQGYSQAPTQEVAASLGYQNLEAAMVQGANPNERQRDVAWDDVLGVSYLERGADQLVGGNDDFVFNLMFLAPNDPGFANAPIQVRNVGLDGIGATQIRFPRGDINNAFVRYDTDMAGNPISWTDVWLDGSPQSPGSRIAAVNIFVIPEPGTLPLLGGAVLPLFFIRSRLRPMRRG